LERERGGEKDTGFADRFGGFVSTFFLRSIFFWVQLGCLDERLVLCAKIGVFVFCCVFFSLLWSEGVSE
jgi:hypothetical protein